MLSISITDPSECTDPGAGGGGDARGCACTALTTRTVGAGCCPTDMGGSVGTLASASGNVGMGTVGTAMGGAGGGTAGAGIAGGGLV